MLPISRTGSLTFYLIPLKNGISGSNRGKHLSCLVIAVRASCLGGSSVYPHHPSCFTSWVAGGDFKGGLVYGKTEGCLYNIDENSVHILDLQATMSHALGIDHERLIYLYQGRDHRLIVIGVESCRLFSGNRLFLSVFSVI